jgi:hypothetical protein
MAVVTDTGCRVCQDAWERLLLKVVIQAGVIRRVREPRMGHSVEGATGYYTGVHRKIKTRLERSNLDT